MDEQELRAKLSNLPLGAVRYFESIGSTNDEALAWAAAQAPDLSLVTADEQTAGRGRSGRKWFTPRGAALAFSLILRPTQAERRYPARITGLGALALVEACKKIGLSARIKWPNDVLLHQRKTAGILVESVWTGDRLEAAILGMGVNVQAASIPPEDQTLFPATCIERELGRELPRMDLLNPILSALLDWRPKMGEAEFLKAWEAALAFRGQQVQVWSDSGQPLSGELIGLEADGSLRLRTTDGREQLIRIGEIHMRPAV